MGETPPRPTLLGGLALPVALVGSCCLWLSGRQVGMLVLTLGVACWFSCYLEPLRRDATSFLAGLWRRMSSFRLPDHTPVLLFLEVDPDWRPEHAIRSANAWRQLASTHDWKAFLDDVNFEVTVPVGVLPFCYPAKDPNGTVECEYWFEQKGAHEPGQRYVIVHVHYSGSWHDFQRFARTTDPATGAPYRLHDNPALAEITAINVRHSTDAADGLNYAIDQYFSTHREADHLANGDMLRRASRATATFQIIPPGCRWAWRANGTGKQPKWSALLAPAIRANDTDLSHVYRGGLRKRDDAEDAEAEHVAEEASTEELEHEVVSGFFMALRGHCDRFEPPAKRMRPTTDADAPVPAPGPAPPPVPQPPSPTPIAAPPPTPPPATTPTPAASQSQPAQQPPARPRVLITALPQLASSSHHLPSVEPEARSVQAAYGGATQAEVLLNISFAELDEALAGREVWCFAGHGDAILCGQRVPAFVSGGGLESVSITALCETVRRHAGTLKLVVLTGCKTLELGLALRRVGLVEVVSCWETVLQDEAGKLFGEAFADAMKRDETPQQAQDAACQAVLAKTEPSRLDNGLGAQVQRFELVDPDDARVVHQSGPNRKRMIQPANVHPRLAAGVPALLDDRAPLQARLPLGMPAPSAMARCVRRDDEVGDLVTSLTGASRTTAVLGLRGMGGVGKTLLAAAALCEAPVREHYREGILWLPIGLNGDKRLHALLRQAADDLHNNLLVPRFGARDPPESSLDAAGLTAWMASRVAHRRVLCVLDDVWEPEVAQAFAATRMVLLVTTRRANVASTAGGDVIDVDVVDDATARRMLASAAGCGVDALPSHADAVLRACCGLPLALAMAGALVAHGTGWADVASEWKAAYDEQPHDDAVLQHDQRQDWSLQAMVRVSVNRLPPELRSAYRGLALAPKRLPLEDELFCVLSGCSDAAAWKEALASHSLLQLAQDGTCMAHDLQLDYLERVGAPDGAKERLREWLTSPATLDRLRKHESLSNTAGGSLGTFELSVAALWRRLVGAGEAAQVAGQAYEAAACLQPASGEEEDEAVLGRAGRWFAAAVLLRTLGGLASAQRLCDKSLRAFRAKLGDTHPRTLTSISNLGLLLQAQGDLAGAEPLYHEALEGLRATLGDTHPATLTSFNNLGLLLKAQGDLDGAAQLLRKALAGSRATLGDTHPDTLRSIGNLGSLLLAQGDLKNAAPLYREALAGYRATLGDAHPNTLTSISNLGALLYAQGDLKTAATLLREALAGRRATLGDTHPDTLASIANLGTLLKAQGDLAGAAPLLHEALAGFRATLGDTHPNTLISINNLGLLLEAQGDLDGAAQLLREALAGSRATLGDRHPNTLTSINSLGSLLQAQGDLAGAEPLYHEALAGFRATLGDTHPNTLTSISNLTQLERQRRQLSGN